MTGQVTIEVDAALGAVAVKRGDLRRLEEEAAVLGGLDHPGVVRVVGLDEREGDTVLLTEYVGPRSLATVGVLPAERAAALVADLAHTVADLHALGVVHGAIRPDHVLVEGDRTVLCGFGGPSSGASPPDDVAGIGAVLRGCLAPSTPAEPIPERRALRHHWQGFRHGALLTLADQATADEPGRRPSARALADAVAGMNGSPRPRRDVTGRARALAGELADLVVVRVGHVRLPRRAALAGALAAVGTVALVTGAWSAVHRPAAEPRQQEGPPAPAPTTPPCAEPDAGRHLADTDGDGCPEVVRVGPGWIEVGGDRYQVGRPGDAVTVGDWDCDGTATVALLQADGRRVWTFATWDRNAEVAADAVGRFPGATGLRRERGPSCDQLLVQRRDGSTVPAFGP
jgi:eukaryotic-like serine/threonine-protein kinase